jgi:hypothetical protein
MIVVKQRRMFCLFILRFLLLPLLYMWYIRTCGGHPQLFLRMNFAIMCILWMNFLSFLGFIFFVPNMNLLMCSLNLRAKLRIFLSLLLRSYKRMEVRSSSHLLDFFHKSYIKSLVPTPLNKMGLPSENIDILWNLVLPLFHIHPYPWIIGIMCSKVWCSLSTVSLLPLFIIFLLILFFLIRTLITPSFT